MLLSLLLAQLAASTSAPIEQTPVAPLKPALAPARLPGCETARAVATPPPVSATVSADAARARQALASAQDAAMQGDRTRARTLLEEARRLDPTNGRAALALSRVLEESSDSAGALVATCEALDRGVSGDDREELLTRRARLAPRSRTQQAATAAAQFTLGLAAAREHQWARAAAAFGRAAALEPSSSAALFNQAVTQILAGQREAAAPLLERYLQLAPEAPERIAVARSFGVLRQPAYSPTRALLLGVLPGAGQFATHRPAAGVLVLALAGGGVAAALSPVTREREVPYVDPNGDPVPYTERYQAYPWRTAGLVGAAAITVLAALEARAFAARSRAPIRLVWDPRGPALQLTMGPRR